MKNSKQVIVVNKALDMPPGKLAAQVAHASLGAVMSVSLHRFNQIHINTPPDSALHSWLNGIFTKVVVYVKSEVKLLAVYEKAKNANKPCFLVQDCGLTCFNGVPTYTCVGIGPMFEDEFIGLTDKLQLLK